MPKKKPKKPPKMSLSEFRSLTDEIALGSSASAASEPAKRLTQLKDIEWIIDLENGLLDKLIAAGVFTPQQLDDIVSATKHREKVHFLLEAVDSMTTVCKERFMTALDDTQQSHVRNYIKYYGQRPPVDNGERCWPLYGCEELREAIVKQCDTFVKNVESTYGLLDELIAVRFLNEQQQQRVENPRLTDAERNRELHKILLRSSEFYYYRFLDCLRKTAQYLIVDCLTGEETARPLEAEKRERLRSQLPLIKARIDIENGLLCELLAFHCITKQHRDAIETASRENRGADKLLSIIERRTQTEFDAFVKCLVKTGQKHVAALLVGDNVTAAMVANFEAGTLGLSNEEHIVEQFNRVLRASAADRAEDIPHALQLMTTGINECLAGLGKDVRLVAAKTKHSIGLFFICQSLAGVHSLYKIYCNRQLKSILEKLFTLLMGGKDRVAIYSLQWMLSDYYQCLENCYRSLELPVLSRIYQFSRANLDGRDAKLPGFRAARNNDADGLPKEIVEHVVLKTAGFLFTVYHETTSRPDLFTFATIAAVSTDWWSVLTSRQWNEQLLKKYFAKYCYPYRIRPFQLFEGLRVNGTGVRGLACLENKVYVIVNGSDVIEVFEVDSSMEKVDQIRVGVSMRPVDIVGSIEQRSLFIADDSDNKCVWEVNIADNVKVTKLVETTHSLRTISVSPKSRKLLLIPDSGDLLLVYGDDGKEMGRIRSPRFMASLCHAVETLRGTYVTCHSRRDSVHVLSADNRSVGICELTVDSEVLREYRDSTRLMGPWYLLLNRRDDRLLVADRYNDQVVMFGSSLTFERVLLQQSEPIRLCYLTDRQLLGICYYSSQEIGFYRTFADLTSS